MKENWTHANEAIDRNMKNVYMVIEKGLVAYKNALLSDDRNSAKAYINFLKSLRSS